MRVEDIASWDLDNSTWGGWGEVIGTVSVDAGVRGSCMGEKEFLARKVVAGLLGRVTDIKKRQNRSQNRKKSRANGKRGKVQSQQKVEPDKVEATKSKKSKEIKDEGLNV
nr:hypothetical protein [Tanacetum cinerariifolium]